MISACKRCGLLNAIAIPSMKNMIVSVREFNPEPLRMVVAYAVQDLSLFEPRRPLSRQPERMDILQAIRQCILKNTGDWYAAYDFYYTSFAYSKIPASMFAPSAKRNSREQVSALAGQIMFLLESINTFFFEVFLLFEELPNHCAKNKDGLRKTIEKLITFVEAKSVPELCNNDDWYLMAGIVLNWYLERLSLTPTYQLEQAINSLRSQNAFYLPRAKRKEIIDEITFALSEELT